MMMNKTYSAKAGEIKRAWHLLDAKDKVLGRLSTAISRLLIGKDKVTYSPNLDGGDYVVVINAKEVKVTGNKELDKKYYSHSGYPGGLKTLRLEEVRARRPERLIEDSVSGMLPKNKLRSSRMARLKVYSGSEHKQSNHFKKTSND